MTVTLDGGTLDTVKPVQVSIQGATINNDLWQDGIYKDRQFVYGKIRSWTLTCRETADWISSDLYYFREKIRDGSSLAFVISGLNIYSCNVNVIVTKIVTEIPVGKDQMRKYRIYSITLEEVV